MRALTLLGYLVALSACKGASENDKNANANSLAAGTTPEVKAQTETPKRDANKSEVKKSVRPERIVWNCTYDGGDLFSLVISEIDYNSSEKIPGRIAAAKYQIKGKNPWGVGTSGSADISIGRGWVDYQLISYAGEYIAFEFPEMSNKIDTNVGDGGDLKCEKVLN